MTFFMILLIMKRRLTTKFVAKTHATIETNIGVDWKDRRLIAALYMGQKAIVRVNGDESEPFIIGMRCEARMSHLTKISSCLYIRN